MSLVVSLSTIPPRFKHLGATLRSLQAQTAQIDEIRLYIPRKYRRFPDYDGSLPDVPDGVRIIQPDDDLGPASKVLFAAEDLRGTNTKIIYCDDDRDYEPDRFAQMIAQQEQQPDACIAPVSFDLDYLGLHAQNLRQPRPRRFRKDWNYRSKRLRQQFRFALTGRREPKPMRPRYVEGGYMAFAEGCGAVLVQPDFFDAAAFDIPAMLWAVDDIWLSGHMERRGVPIWMPALFDVPPETENRVHDPLHSSVIEGANREQANRACIRYMQDTYGIWL